MGFNLAFREVFYYLYGCVPLLKTYQKNIMHDNILLYSWHYLPSQPSLLLSLIKKTPQSKQQAPQQDMSPLWYKNKGGQGS